MARHLHFDCFSGVSGDMVLGALVDAGLPLADLVRGLKRVHAKGYRLRAHRVRRGAVPATKVDVLIANGFRAPLTFAAIKRLIVTSGLPDPVKQRSIDVFTLLAHAEGIAHGVKTERVRFHEVGVVDSIVDVIGGVLGCHLLGIDYVTASSINLGAGTIETSHGRLPVPGPAVAALATGIPVHSDGPPRELTTPTGMALMKTLASQFGPLPPLRVSATGYGAGTADPHGWPNVLRVFIGESGDGERDTVTQ
ncbi:MAG TPA: LarC family nickel insertion protein, partial [Nitrospirales bacterium]|nr:LarC family nickel insertion protein [Nitrospirales bacterium]